MSEKKRTAKKNKDRFLVIERLPYTFFQPLYFASKEVGEDNLKEASLPIWEGYSYGNQRTACRVCPGQKPMAFAAIRINYPDVWLELLELEGRLGKGYWQDPTDGLLSLEEIADKGQEKYAAGGYLTR